MKRFTKFISETPENRVSLKEYDTHDDFDKQDKLPNPVHDHKWRQVGSVRKVDGKYHGFHYGTNKYVGSADTSAEAKQAVLDAHEKHTKSLKEEIILERGEDSKGYKRSTESGAGLTRKGAKHFGVKTAVTGKVKPGSKAAKRRKSFCARMSGMKGPMKDEKGRPTRKAMSLRRWRCRE